MQPQKPVESKRRNWKYMLFNIFFIPTTGLVALHVNSVAIRGLAPHTAQKIAFGCDVAHIISLVFLFLVFLSLTEAFKVIRIGVPDTVKNPNFDARYLLTVAALLMVVDFLAFYLGLTHQTLFRTKINFISLMIAAGYTAATTYVAFLHVKLKENE